MVYKHAVVFCTKLLLSHIISHTIHSTTTGKFFVAKFHKESDKYVNKYEFYHKIENAGTINNKIFDDEGDGE